MIRVLVFDVGFSCAWACLQRGSDPACGTHHVAGSSINFGTAMRDADLFMSRIVKQVEPSHIVRARPFIGRFVRPMQLLPIMGFSAKVEEVASRHGIECFEVVESDARKAFLGQTPRKSKDIKLAVIAGCRQRGWTVSDNHQADALCVAAFALDRLDPKRGHENAPLFKHQEITT